MNLFFEEKRQQRKLKHLWSSLCKVSSVWKKYEEKTIKTGFKKSKRLTFNKNNKVQARDAA